MREHYITLFNSRYLPQGLALYTSLLRFAGDFKLWVLCMDRRTHQFFQNEKFQHIEVIGIWEVEELFPDLVRLKNDRTVAEYCWTLTPFCPELVFDRDDSVQRVTYLDADIWFLRSPEPIFQEFEESCKAILITSHGYAPHWDQSDLCGIFCVQFLIFTKQRSSKVLNAWQKQCLDWCYAKPELGRFGDQKYLDSWPYDYSDLVHILERQHYCLAPWNVDRFSQNEAIIYHFHGLKILTSNWISLGDYPIPEVVRHSIYKKYTIDLLQWIEFLSNKKLFSASSELAVFSSIANSYVRRIRQIFKNLINISNVMKLNG